MARKDAALDPGLADLPPEMRWREWMRRVEAVLFASASPVGPEALARIVGDGVSVELLVEDVAASLQDRPYQISRVAGGWLLHTRPAYAEAIRIAGDVADQTVSLSEFDLSVLLAIAYHQPVTRDGLKDIFGKDVSRDVIGRLAEHGLIATGPRAPRRGAPYTFVTTETFLVTFAMDSLDDLPDPELLADAGLRAER